MAVPTNTVQTFDISRIREDLGDVINRLDKYETPFYSDMAEQGADSTSPEWMVDEAPAPDTNNAVVEGADAETDTMGPPDKVRNYTQILDKTFQVSSTAQVVNTAGMKEMARRMLLGGIALRTEVEVAMTSNQASVAGNATTARKMGGAEAFIVTNVNGGAGYASGGFNTGTKLIAASTDGTPRAATEAQLKDVIRKVWEQGGKNLNVLVGGAQKQVMSGFAGIATKQSAVSGSNSSQVTIYGAADVYVSDFGRHLIQPTRFIRNRTALVIDKSTWKRRVLQPMKPSDLAKTGHSDRKMFAIELTLQCQNEKANGKVADLT